MLHACTLGRRVGLVTINPVFVPCHQDQIAALGLRERVVAVRAVQAEVADYNRAFDDAALAARMRGLRAPGPADARRGVEVVVPAAATPCCSSPAKEDSRSTARRC